MGNDRIELLRLAVDLAKAAYANNTGLAMSVKHNAERAAKAAETDVLSELVTHYFEHLSHLAATSQET